jgi:DNA-binding NarL/FixJ family response regulator
MKQVVIGFGLLILALLILFQLARFAPTGSGLKVEWMIAGFSLLFFGIGLYLSRKMFRKEIIREKEIILEKQVIVEVPASAPIDEKKLEQTGLSKREYEILLLIGEGLSNQQIAEKLFVSENTIKKHVSNLFLKLDVERRTEAVRRGKELRII